jgi:hypothetical protein
LYRTLFIHCLSATMLRAMSAFVVMSALTQLEEPGGRTYLTEQAVTYVDKPLYIYHLFRTIKQIYAG